MSNLLDDNSSFIFDTPNDQRIKWMGTPTIPYKLSLVEGQALSVLLGMVIILSFIILIVSLAIGALKTILISLIIIITCFAIPVFLKRKRQRNTYYAITEESLLFKLWRYGKKKTYAIPIKDIKNIILQRHKTKNGLSDKGTLLFMLPYKANFKTYDFDSGKYRHNPTFEMIENPDEVFKIIQDLNNTNKLKPKI